MNVTSTSVYRVMEESFPNFYFVTEIFEDVKTCIFDLRNFQDIERVKHFYGAEGIKFAVPKKLLVGKNRMVVRGEKVQR